MEEAWLWYGPYDPVSLAHVLQAGATTVSTALFHLPAGQVGPSSSLQVAPGGRSGPRRR